MFQAACTEAAADGLPFVTVAPGIVAMRRGIFECVLAGRDHDRLYGQTVTAGGAPGGLIEGHPCDMDRLGFDCVQCSDRPVQPLIRTDGASVSATWDKAPNRVAGALGRFQFEPGPDDARVFASAACTRKENRLLQKSMHAAIDTHTVRPCARLVHGSAVADQAATPGAGAMTHSIRMIPLSAASFVSDFRSTGEYPFIGDKAGTAVNRGYAKLDAADTRRFGSVRNADVLPVLDGAFKHDPEWLAGQGIGLLDSEYRTR